MSMFERVFENDPKKEEKKKQKKSTIPSTAGAVPVKNAKGEISMETVKVKRYIAGKIPDFVETLVEEKVTQPPKITSIPKTVQSSPQVVHHERRIDHGKRQVFEPQIIKKAEQIIEPDEETIKFTTDAKRRMLKEQLLKTQVETSIAQTAEESSATEESSEEESESESENETLPRLKPIFVPKDGRITTPLNPEDEDIVEEMKKAEIEEKRRSETKEIVAKLVSEEIIQKNKVDDEENTVITDDDDEETAFEQWKIRELNRINRDLEETEAHEAEKREIQRLRLMTEEERQAHLAANPKIITNQAVKGEYKYLQKYYHRGAFYLDTEDNVLKQNFAEPTLEDKFDKSVLPKVLQVKNFGKAGRTKYTHLVDQDTSCFEGAWSKKNELAGQFAQKIGGGMKPIFERPGSKRKHQ